MENKSLRIIDGFVDIEQMDDSLIIDMKYATDDNFVGKASYPVRKCVLQYETAKKLVAANKEFKEYGYKIKVFDAYRPLSVQKIMWGFMPNEDFVANPAKGSVHNRGCAVDITLVNSEGNEVEMPSPFDDFSEKAHIKYMGASPEAIKNREFMAGIMVKHGFLRMESEWWHFNDENYKQYPVCDTPLEAFL